MRCHCLFEQRQDPRFWEQYLTFIVVCLCMIASSRYKALWLSESGFVDGVDNIDDRNASRPVGPTPTMSGPQLTSLLPLQSFLQSGFEKIATFHL